MGGEVFQIYHIQTFRISKNAISLIEYTFILPITGIYWAPSSG